MGWDENPRYEMYRQCMELLVQQSPEIVRDTRRALIRLNGLVQGLEALVVLFEGPQRVEGWYEQER